MKTIIKLSVLIILTFFLSSNEHIFGQCSHSSLESNSCVEAKSTNPWGVGTTNISSIVGCLGVGEKDYWKIEVGGKYYILEVKGNSQTTQFNYSFKMRIENQRLVVEKRFSWSPAIIFQLYNFNCTKINCSGASGTKLNYRYNHLCFYTPTHGGFGMRTPQLEVSENENTLTLIPNPTSNIANLNFIGIRPQKIAVYNSLGSMVFEILNPEETAQRIDVSRFAPGVYIIQVSDGAMNYTKKLIVN